MFDLKIGFKCNNNCVHCVVADKRNTDDLSLRQIKSIISSIHPKERFIQITGGEPSTYKYLPDILKMCAERNLITCIQSNGTGFSNKNFVEQCAPYIGSVHLAIHSYNKDIHDDIVGAKGMWDLTIKGFDNLIEAGVKISTQTVTTTYNIGTLYDTFKFIQSKRPGTIMSMTYPHLMGNAALNKEILCFRYSEYKEEIQRTLKDFSQYIFTEAYPICYLHPYYDNLYSTAEQSIIYGCHRNGADYSENTKESINYNQADLRDKRKAPRCKECIYNNVCIGVWKDYIDLFKSNLDLYPIHGEVV